jgi:hypothetical protein
MPITKQIILNSNSLIFFGLIKFNIKILKNNSSKLIGII